jgi:hypothetical protein
MMLHFPATSVCSRFGQQTADQNGLYRKNSQFDVEVRVK